MSLILGGVLDIRGGTFSLAQVAPGGTTAGTHGIVIGTRSTLRIGSGTLVDANPGDGVSLNNGAAFEIRTDVASTISNNGTAGNTNGFPINCTGTGTETSIGIPTTGAVPIFTGNLAGNAPNNCTGF